MGNRQPNYNQKIGSNSECPMCKMQFSRKHTYGYVSIAPQLYFCQCFLE